MYSGVHTHILTYVCISNISSIFIELIYYLLWPKVVIYKGGSALATRKKSIDLRYGPHGIYFDFGLENYNCFKKYLWKSNLWYERFKSIRAVTSINNANQAHMQYYRSEGTRPHKSFLMQAFEKNRCENQKIVKIAYSLKIFRGNAG